MKLTDAQLAEFDETGYLFFPELFSADEMAVINAEVPKIYTMRRDEVWRESDGDAVRTAFAAHTYNEVFAKVARHPRLVEPVMQLVDGPVYMHQNKINAKAAFDGDVWQWHQDYGTWSRDDLMPEPRAMNIALFLDEVRPVNGALMFIPGSHKLGVIEAGHDLLTTSYPLWTLDKQTVSKLANENGIVAPTGKPGSAVVFHANIVHASPGNISPWDRTIHYLSLCHVDNHIRRFKRPEFIAHRDFTAIECLADDCLLSEVAVAAE
ncbi:MAG: proline hydroxylase [Rhodospirillaceae bacterium]|jgi:ectoine hydroxylase|nr:proline hydroxylase [Rhodospirillaceae bacterium]MBT6138901.1 proline hydroxylase [Rhodospirillaceae bacterium]